MPFKVISDNFKRNLGLLSQPSSKVAYQQPLETDLHTGLQDSIHWLPCMMRYESAFLRHWEVVKILYDECLNEKSIITEIIKEQKHTIIWIFRQLSAISIMPKMVGIIIWRADNRRLTCRSTVYIWYGVWYIEKCNAVVAKNMVEYVCIVRYYTLQGGQEESTRTYYNVRVTWIPPSDLISEIIQNMRLNVPGFEFFAVCLLWEGPSPPYRPDFWVFHQWFPKSHWQGCH